MTQGKTNKQIKDSKNLVKLGYSAIILLVIIMVMVNWTESLPSHHSEYGPPHNYWVPTTSDTLDTPYGKSDMNCGDYDSINTYTTFYDVPVTQDSLIIVDAILYRKGKEQWTPVYPDEYVMWITAEGDTIWE
tara:strand:+ start:465 stop:860 length:396 start_codon:yes stop_codon:yes gene_type:complete